MGRRTTGLQEGDARLQSGDVDEPLQDAKDDIERASLTSADEPRGRLPPLLLVLALGVLSTPMVLLWFDELQSVWATLFSLVVVWVVCPAVVCSRWPRVCKLVRDELARTCRTPMRQIVSASVIGVVSAATGLASWHFLRDPLHLPIEPTRISLEHYGLYDDKPAGSIFLIVWLTLVNPVEEEFFWRVFLMQLLHAHWADSRLLRSRPRGAVYAAGLASSVLYAAYHVPVVAAVAPLPLALLAGVCLVGFGAFLQLLTQAGFVIVALGIHVAGDLVVGMVFADIVWPDFPLRDRA